MTEYNPPSYDQPLAAGASTADQQSSSDASAKDQAVEAAQSGKQAAGEVAQTATDAAKNVAQETTSQAKQLAGKTGEQITEQANVQKDALVGGLRSLVDQLSAMTDHADNDGIAVELAGQARDRARSAADWLDAREPNEVVDGIRTLGRDRPGAYLAGALAAGVLAGRLTRGVAAVHSDGAGSAQPSGSGAAGTGGGEHRSDVDTADAPGPGSAPQGGLYSDDTFYSRPTPGTST
jgi:hypothetical protein